MKSVRRDLAASVLRFPPISLAILSHSPLLFFLARAECGFLDELRSRNMGEVGGLGRILRSQGKWQLRVERLVLREFEKGFQD